MSTTIPEATSLHAWKAIADQRQADLEHLKLHCDSLEAALRARTEEIYPDLRAQIENLRTSLQQAIDYADAAAREEGMPEGKQCKRLAVQEVTLTGPLGGRPVVVFDVAKARALIGDSALMDEDRGGSQDAMK